MVEAVGKYVVIKKREDTGVLTRPKPSNVGEVVSVKTNKNDNEKGIFLGKGDTVAFKTDNVIEITGHIVVEKSDIIAKVKE